MRLVFAIPGNLSTPTGGYVYARRIIAELGSRGFEVEVIDLGEGFPHPPEPVRGAAIARIEGLRPDGPIIVDGLAFGVMPELAVRAGTRRLIALVHHPLALETGLGVAAAHRMRASERAALGGACRVIVTSATTARVLATDYGVAPERITVAPPGTDCVACARGSAEGTSLLAVGSLVPRKGYDVLVAALAHVAELPWRLTVVGDPSRDPQTAAAIAADIVRTGLETRITLAGAVSVRRLAACYDQADLFVLASRYEGYGMAYAEAIAHGLPVIATRTGAVPDTVGSGAVLVAPDDVSALADALRVLLGDPARRTRLAAAARAVARQLPTWEQAADRIACAVATAMGRSLP